MFQLSSKSVNSFAKSLATGSIVGVLLAGCGGAGGTGGGGVGGTSGGGVVATPVLPDLITASLIVDVNGDGKNDVVMSSQGGGYPSLLVLINNGTGSSFTKSATAVPPQYLGVNGSAVDIQSGDFNKDGKIDLLVVTVDTSPANFYNASQIQLFLGNGNGTFTDATANITSGAWPAWPIQQSAFPIPGFTGWVEHVRVADIDGDGFLDFVTTSIVAAAGTVYRNDGTGKFSPAAMTITGLVTLSGSGPLVLSSLNSRDVLVGDVNNDGKLDLVSLADGMTYINTSTPGVISFNALAGTLPGLLPQGNGIPEGVLVDINGDGFLDVLSAALLGPTNPVSAYINNGAGVFTLNNTVLLPAQPTVDNARQWLTADFNGDGKLDVLILTNGLDQSPYPGARNWLLLNNGAGKLVDATATSLDLLAGYTHQAAIGDLNGDGKPDLLLNNSANCNGTTMACANEPRFWLNNGLGKFTSYNPVIQ